MTTMPDVITWTYIAGEGYDIDMAESPLDDHLMALIESGIPLPWPQTPENDADVQTIMEALRRIVAR